MNILLDPKPTSNPRAYVWTISPWDPGTDSTPHVWVAQKRLRSGIVVFEPEAGNASVVLGQKARAQFSCTVTVSAPPGWLIESDCARLWPSIWPPMHCAARRYAIYPADRPDLQPVAAAAARGQMIQMPRENFGPAAMRLPTLGAVQAQAIRSTCTQRLGAVRWALLNGTTAYIEQEDGPQLPPWMGWRVHGPTRPDEVAGSGIFFDTGHQQCTEAVQLFWLNGALAYERAWHAYHRDTGLPVTADDYGDPGPKYVAGTGDPNNGWLPEFIGVAANPDPLPLPYDSAHSIRGFRFAVALSEMMDSALVRRQIASYAAQMRLQFSEIGPIPAYGYEPPSLRNSLAVAQAHPNTGGRMEAGRIRGWGAFLMAQHLKLGQGSDGDRRWAQMFMEWVQTCTPAHGIPQRVMENPPPAGQLDVWYNPTWDLAHAFEVPISHIPTCALALQSAADPTKCDALAAGSSLYESCRKGPYYGGEQGPMDYVFVAHRGGAPVDLVVDGTHYTPQVVGDSTHCDSFCALLDMIDSGTDWLHVSTTIGHTAPDVPSKKAWLEAQTDLYGRSFLLARMQR